MFNSTLKNNIAANFAGSFWQALMGWFSSPLYIKFMGIESYGWSVCLPRCRLYSASWMWAWQHPHPRDGEAFRAAGEEAGDAQSCPHSGDVVLGYRGCCRIAIMSLSSIIAATGSRPGQLSPGTLNRRCCLWAGNGFSRCRRILRRGIEGLQKLVLLTVSLSSRAPCAARVLF